MFVCLSPFLSCSSPKQGLQHPLTVKAGTLSNPSILTTIQQFITLLFLESLAPKCSSSSSSTTWATRANWREVGLQAA